MGSTLERRVLCVDDSIDNCELIGFILSQEGYEVELVQSVTIAAQLLETCDFVLCVFDLSFKDGTGFDLLEKVQTIAPLLPVVICSGDNRPSTQQQVMQAGAQAFMAKPIDYDLLIATIARLLHPTESGVAKGYGSS